MFVAAVNVTMTTLLAVQARRSTSASLDAAGVCGREVEAGDGLPRFDCNDIGDGHSDA